MKMFKVKTWIFDNADNLYNTFTGDNYYDCLVLSLYNHVDLFQG